MSKVQVLELSVTGFREPKEMKVEGTEAYNSTNTERIAIDPQKDIFFPNEPRRFNSFKDWLKAEAPKPDKNYRKPSLFNPGRAVPKILVEQGNGFCISSEINFKEWEHKADMIDQRGMDEAIFKLGRKAYMTDTMSKVLLMLAGSVVLMTIILGIIAMMIKFSDKPIDPNAPKAQPTAVLVPGPLQK